MKKIIALITILITSSSCVKQSQEPDKVTQADLYYNKGLEYNLKNDDKTAILYYDSAIMIRDDARYYNNRGASKSSMGDTFGAFADYSIAMQFDSLDCTTITNLGNYYQRKKEYKVALQYYHRSARISEKQAIFDLIGYCEYMLGNYKEALNYFKKHLTGGSPGFPQDSHLYMGYCYEKLGDINAAKEHWEQAAKMGEEEAKHKLDSLKRR